MTTELEKTFFDTFGIEKKQTCVSKDTCNNYVNYQDCNGCNAYNYPQITDHILLELICILSKYQKNVGSLLEICETDKNSIKEEILDMLIFRDTALKHQVQAIFEGKDESNKIFL